VCRPYCLTNSDQIPHGNAWEKGVFIGVIHINPSQGAGGASALRNFWDSYIRPCGFTWSAVKFGIVAVARWRVMHAAMGSDVVGDRRS